MIRSLGYFLLCLSLLGCSDNDASDTSNTTGNSSNGIYTEGVHYKVLENPIQHTSDDIIVTEFFWYGCSHCANFEPLIHQWETIKAAGVSLQQSPAMWNKAMQLHARAFFLAQTLDNSDKLHAQLFSEIMSLHGQKNLEKHKEKLAGVFAEYGLEKEAFYQQLDSFKINGQVSQADKIMKQAELKGTPLLVVNGKYAINNKSIKNAAELLAIADFLISKELSQKSAHKS